MEARTSEPREMHILIVEDNRDLQESLAAVLEMEGYRVSCASNGRDALDQLRSQRLPDIILLDLMMPVMNGWEFREEQKQDSLLAPIPVVVLSAVADGTDREQVLDATILGKPVNFDVLRKTMERLHPSMTRKGFLTTQ